MGLFSGVSTIRALKKISAGGEAKLSIAQITSLVVNMLDAKNNLSSEEFEEVYYLYNKLKKETEKLPMNQEMYITVAKKIIAGFDAKAPYEKYGGGDKREMSLLLKEVRSEGNKRNASGTQGKAKNYNLSKEEKEYVEYMLRQSDGAITRSDAIRMMKIFDLGHTESKAAALREFDSLASEIINDSDYSTRGVLTKTYRISYLAGMLFPNGVLTKDESDALAKKYSDIITQKAIDSDKDLQ